uniref:Retrovirus-related Pol polyprotein from transposon TNT 1-94 n=1 Tax=Panagrellus redivivus TaxID=6233 RepID=A0A7E4ZQ62_PANRE
MDTSGSNPNAKEDHTALQYEGFVHVFEKRAYVFSTYRATNRPLKSSHSEAIASMDMYGLKGNYKGRRTAVQYEGFIHVFKQCASVSNTCHAINRPLKGATSSETSRSDNKAWMRALAMRMDRLSNIYPEQTEACQWTISALNATPKRATRPYKTMNLFTFLKMRIPKWKEKIKTLPVCQINYRTQKMVRLNVEFA